MALKTKKSADADIATTVRDILNAGKEDSKKVAEEVKKETEKVKMATTKAVAETKAKAEAKAKAEEREKMKAEIIAELKAAGVISDDAKKPGRKPKAENSDNNKNV